MRRSSHQIVSFNTLQRRLARGQLLTRGESDWLFRLAHVSAMAQVVFGDKHKAQRWLSKPNAWRGKRPWRCSALTPAWV